MGTNADCLTNKMPELLQVMKTHDPSIFCVCEVLPKKIRDKIYEEMFAVEGYDMVAHPNINANKGRGSIMYIKKGLNHKEVILKGEGKDFEEHIVQEISLNSKESIICANIYRRPSSSPQNNDRLILLKQEIATLNIPTIFTGDYNLPEIKWPSGTVPGTNTQDFEHRFIECIRDCFLFQHVDENTRQRGNNEPSCLDLIFSSDENQVRNLKYLAPLGKSDHAILKFEIPCVPDKSAPKIKVLYEKGNYQAFNDHLNNINWLEEFNKYPNDVNKQWTFFRDKFLEAELKFVPRKKVFINGHLSKKFSRPLDKKSLKLMKKKNHIFSNIRKNIATEEEKLGFNRLKNQVRALTKKSKKVFEKLIAKNAKQNPKAFWAYTQSKMKFKSTIPDLIKPETEENPEYASTDEEKAQLLVDYFSSVFTTEPNGEAMPEFPEQKYDEVLDDIKIDEEMVKKKLKKLKKNKSPGPDNIHPRVLNELADSISYPLSIIFETSLKNKALPDEWKHANVCAIFKKGKKTLPNNYRPVSLTSVVCKVMESIIRDGIVDHMTRNNLFSPKQFGFLAGRSTVLQLLHVLKIWIEILDQGGSLDAIYCDFMKAFDKVPHKRLVYKTGKYGIKGNVLGWINSFLSDRTHQVSLNGKSSKIASVTSGIPQGSVLGPILFVLYINDLPEVVDKDSFAFLFADDTKMFRAILNLLDIQVVQEDIHKLVEWSDKWLLKFHPDKCIHMTIGLNKNMNFYYHYDMDGHVLKKSTCEKDIGVHVDNNLNFKEHINNTINKANRVLAIVRKTYDFMDIPTFRYIFKGLIRPVLEYAAPVWSPHHVNLKEMIENVQRRATKMVPGLSHLEYPERLRKIGMPTLAYRRVRGDMIQVFKLVATSKNSYDQSLPPLFTLSKNPKGLRKNSLNINRPDFKKDIGKYSFTSRVCKLWNSLPDNIVTATDVKSFEMALDKHWEKQELMYDNFKAEIHVK